MRYILLLAVAFSIVSCNSSQKAEELHVNKGRITVAADESFKHIVDAQVAAYKAHYPETEFDVIYTPEQKAIGLMLSDSAELAVVSRELTVEEQKYFTSRQLEYLPGRMAWDAVVLIVNKENPLEKITTSSIKEILEGENTERKLVFDNSSSSNLNFLLNYFNPQNLYRENIFAANGTLDVFNYIEKNKKAIGVIGMNWISDEDHKESRELRERVKILSVGETLETVYQPTLSTVRKSEYPFIKTVYLHTTQHRWGVAKGFVRFACSQIGQLVVEKMGLQPFYLIPKKYQMFDSKEIVTTE